MTHIRLTPWIQDSQQPIVVILGTNEIASAIAVELVGASYSVILSDDPFPPVMRRAMAFHDALFGDRAQIGGIEGERAENAREIASTLAKPGHVVVTELHLTDLIALLPIKILIDARMQKHRVTPDFRGVVDITVGIGPNFAVGTNCNIAVETRPAKNGTVVRFGETDQPDGVARSLGGFGVERFVYSDRPGRWHTAVEIGTRVYKGFVVGHLDGQPVPAPIDGVLRGIVRDCTSVPAGVKLLEVDARGRNAQWTGTDERGRAIARATFAAIQLHALRPPMADATARLFSR